MKLIPLPEGQTDYTGLIYNCTRNSACQPAFYVPIDLVSDLYLYVDLPGKPDLVEIYAKPTCVAPDALGGDFNDDFNDDFDIGDLIADLQFFSWDYVIGQKPDGTWYGVFQSLENELTNPIFKEKVRCFVIGMDVTIGGNVYTFFSEEICHEYCNDMCRVDACLPEGEPPDSELLFDINGIYYGLHNGPDTPLGNVKIRYFHRYWVRRCQILEKGNRITFKNNLIRSFKSELTKQFEFRGEFMPTFYKDYILAAFSRGQVTMKGKNWLVVDTELDLVDEDMEWWKPIFQLEQYFRQYFGCDDSVCIEPLLGDFNGSMGDIPCSGDTVGDINDLITVNSYCPGGFTFSLESYNTSVLSTPPVINPDGTFTITVGDVYYTTPVVLFTYKITCSDGRENVGVISADAINCECVDVQLVGLPNLPDGTVGVSYNYTLNYTGTLPFVLTILEKPSWMTISVSGTNVILSGIPDVSGTGIVVEIQVTNCESGSVVYGDTIDIAETEGNPDTVCLGDTQGEACECLEGLVTVYVAPPNTAVVTGIAVYQDAALTTLLPIGYIKDPVSGQIWFFDGSETIDTGHTC